MVEWRADRGIVGVFEVKLGDDQLTDFELVVLRELSKHYDVFLIRIFNRDTESRFMVYNIDEDGVDKLRYDFAEPDYREWMETL